MNRLIEAILGAIARLGTARRVAVPVVISACALTMVAPVVSAGAAAPEFTELSADFCAAGFGYDSNARRSRAGAGAPMPALAAIKSEVEESDEVIAGTAYMVRNIRLSGSSDPSPITAVGDTVFFSATGRAAVSCGRATAPKPAPSESRTSSPAAALRILRVRGRRCAPVLLRGRRHARPRALRQRWHISRHAPDQGHQVGGVVRAFRNGGCQRHALLLSRRPGRSRAVEERWNGRRHAAREGSEGGTQGLVSGRDHQRRSEHLLLGVQQGQRCAPGMAQ